MITKIKAVFWLSCSTKEAHYWHQESQVQSKMLSGGWVRPLAHNGYGFVKLPLYHKKMNTNKGNLRSEHKADVTSSRDYLAENLLRRTKEKKKKCEAGLLKNFCQF